jgi:hypothetical protein
MRVAAEKELKKRLLILWLSLEGGFLRMTWADGALLAGRNDVKEGRHGR